MLESLEFSVTFPSTGKAFEGKHVFTSGLTSISGPNEAGKSLRQEMVRYALFGTKALRAGNGEYKKLSVTLSFSARGIGYCVKRATNATLETADGTALASGTVVVNAKIIEILGYGIEVFDVANNCAQGKVEQLGDMKPTERRAMVDHVIGLDTLDSITDEAGKKANTHKQVADAMRAKLVAPTPVQMPVDYVESKYLQQSIEDLRVISGEVNMLRGWLSNPGLAVPTVPTLPCPETLEELQAHEVQRKTNASRRGELNADLRRLKPIDKSPAEIDALELALVSYQAWTTKKKLLLEGDHTCPECGHHWYEQSKLLKNYEDVEETPPPGINELDIAAMRSRLGDRDEAQSIAAELAKVPELEDRTSKIIELKTYLREKSRYDEALAEAQEYTTKRTAKQTRLDEISPLIEQLPDLTRKLHESERYELEQQLYDQSSKAYTDAVKELERVTSVAEDWAKAKTALKDLRTTVKGYLVPSLNRVASSLLSQMTNGERTQVQLNEEFEILIDGQPLATLSGSAKAVANLALRIGLGTVLTNKSFSVFMGDEIDASMDLDRAEYTAACLKNLTQTISQVVLISHKKLEADHYIEL